MNIWEFPEKCSNCGRFDNGNEKEPTTYLDVKTRSCEFCFNELDEELLEKES